MRLHKDDYPKFKQVALFARKRPLRVELDNLIPPPPYQYIEDIPPKTYYVPSIKGPTVFQGADTITDKEIEKHRPHLIEKIKEIMGSSEEIKTLSPLLPLRKGHLVSLITAGVLDGKVENPDGSFILIKGFSERFSYTKTEDNKEITRDTYAVGIWVIEQSGKWYDIY